MLGSLSVAVGMVQVPVENFLSQVSPPPSCIISDMSFPWTVETARKLNVPRILFHETCCFSLLCSYNIRHYKPHECITSESEPFVIPGLPDRIEVSKAQLPEEFAGSVKFREICGKIYDVESMVSGVLVNSFDALEPEYVKSYEKSTGKKVWIVGPVSLCNTTTLDKSHRGKKASTAYTDCLKWLDSKKAKSIVYVYFGSMCQFTTPPLIEIGLGLEASLKDFIWVIRGNNERSIEVEKWLSNGFEEMQKTGSFLTRLWRIGLQSLKKRMTCSLL